MLPLSGSDIRYSRSIRRTKPYRAASKEGRMLFSQELEIGDILISQAMRSHVLTDRRPCIAISHQVNTESFW